LAASLKQRILKAALGHNEYGEKTNGKRARRPAITLPALQSFQPPSTRHRVVTRNRLTNDVVAS
jgi:hypothetical protein